MDITIESQIATVTVYPDRARVTSHGRAELTPGHHRLLIDELPLSLEPESVRVSGRGTAQVRLMGVDVTRRNYEETPADNVRDLERQIEQLEDELRVLQDSQAGLAAQAKYLDGLRQATVQYAKGLARGRTTVEDQARLGHFLQEQDAEIRSAARELDKQQRDLSRRLNKLRQDLSALQSARPRQRYQARVDLEVLAEGVFNLEISYVVGRAGWQPLYDLRLLETDDGHALEVTYIAQVTQNSGQNWQGVQLVLSTARPALNQRLPELKPWYVDVYVPQPPPPAPVRSRAAAPMAMSASPQAFMKADSMEMAESMPEMVAEVAVAAVQANGSVITFAVAGQSDIPSDGSPHKNVINRFKLTPRLDYLAVPKHTDAVYRRVTVNNDSAGPLLAGQASLFAGDEFIGSTQLDYTPAGEEIELLLGVEERITIERELIRRDVDKALLRDRRQLRYGYKIEMQNLLSAEARVEVHDHIPVARNEQIKVRLEKTTPEPAKKSDLNLMEWRLTLAAGAKQTIQYDYLVEYPRSVTVTGLLD